MFGLEDKLRLILTEKIWSELISGEALERVNDEELVEEGVGVAEDIVMVTSWGVWVSDGAAVPEEVYLLIFNL